jgi:hypothetical protein
MADNPDSKPKTPKKAPAKKPQENNSPQSIPQGKLPAWSVVTLSFLIGAGLTVALLFAIYRSGTLAPNNESDAQLRAMADRVASIEGQKSRLDTLENSVSRLEATRNSLAALQEKEESDVHRLEAALSDLRNENPVKLNLTPLENRVASLEQKVQAISQVEFAEKERLLALALSGLALKEALDRGVPFATEFSVVKNLLHAQSNLSALGDYADKGVATSAALLSHFPEVAQAIQNTDLPENPNAWERTRNFFYKLVSVRKVGNVEGNDVEAIIARIEYDLQQNDSAGAAREFQSLPERAQNAAGTWGKDLAMRAEADRLMRELLLTAAQGLQPQKPPKAE